ncbi:MAG: hypothetical protein KDD33_00415 [Bdellovibrionales bacterium]|nr:hypothetical protein [Bdellovibrionales bacterium]
MERLVSSEEIGFCQNLLGHSWAKEKLKRLIIEFMAWRGPGGASDLDAKKKFLQWRSEQHPFTVIKDTRNHIRLIDDHHGFYSFYYFAEEKPFLLKVQVAIDFSKGDWTDKKMMEYLAQEQKIFIENCPSPSLADLQSIPERISDIKDAPERSIVSMLFESFDVPMKGYDFVPFIQFLFAQHLRSIGQSIPPRALTSPATLENLKESVLHSESALTFLRDHVGDKTSEIRQLQVRTFFAARLAELNEGRE